MRDSLLACSYIPFSKRSLLFPRLQTKNVKQLRLVMGFQAKRMAAFRDAVKNLAEDGDETNATDS